MLAAPVSGARPTSVSTTGVAAEEEGAGFLAFMGEHQAFKTQTKAG